MDDLYNKLYEALPEDGIQKTDGQKTKKGYDTTGYGYQWCVDRLNTACGLEGWEYNYTILRETSGKFKTGTPFYDITVEVTITIKDTGSRKCVGGHIAILYADALKGAITNAFKKTAAFFGVGSAAYRGKVDDDNEPLPERPTTEIDRTINSDLIESLNEIADGLDLTEEERKKHAAYLGKYQHNKDALEAYLQKMKIKRDDKELDDAAEKGFQSGASGQKEQEVSE